jgi:uncharacterized lipoprotein YajG
MKACILVAIAVTGAGSAASAQAPAPPAAVVTQHTVHTQTVTHKDGRAHRHVTRVVHRSALKTPTGTATRTITATTTTTPK